jgi:YidC/Oxa1 family membrane protein insertase
MFNTYLYQPILQVLLWLNSVTGNLGLAIIAITLLIRLILYPLSMPAMRTAVKMRELQPEIEKLKKKHKNDKVGLQQAQLALFQEHKLNPAAGCLPYILQFAILIALYRVFMDYLQNGVAAEVTLDFLWFNLKNPDPYYVLPVVAAVSQFFLSLMVLPAADASAEKTLAAATKDKEDDKAANDLSSMAASMQSQMAFVMPVMTGFLALSFPSGLTLYWIFSTIFSVVQQYIVSGWGGLVRVPGYANKLLNLKK